MVRIISMKSRLLQFLAALNTKHLSVAQYRHKTKTFGFDAIQTGV